MYIKSVHIKDFRILKDLHVKFQGGEQGKNTINVIAGVNGSGKSSLLEAIYAYLSTSKQQGSKMELADSRQKLPWEESQKDPSWSDIYGFLKALKTKNTNKTPPFDDPRIILVPAHLDFEYQSVNQLKSMYEPFLRIGGKVLGQAEFYIREYVLAKERASNIANSTQRTQQAVAAFNGHFQDTSLLTQLHDLDKNRYNRPVFKNVKGDLVTIEQLSDGEKQLYGRVVALMMLQPRNSIILIDEPEVSLHPAWQHQIMRIYANIGENNQFIVATHSPQIIASTSYRNLILLRRENEKIVPVYPQHPPSGVDVNSILTEIMGAQDEPAEVAGLCRIPVLDEKAV